MKKIISILALTMVCVLAFSGCSKKDDDDKKSSGGLSTKTEGTLTVCSDVPYPPFEDQVDGKFVGVDPDLMAAIAEDNDLKVKIVDTDFDSIFTQLKAGACDVIASSVSITDERKASNDFSDPYYEIKQSLLVNNDEKATLTDLDKLKGKIVGVQSETTGATFAKDAAEANGYTVKEFTGADEVFAALRAGSIDASLQDYPVNYGESSTNKTSTITKSFPGNEQYGFVISKDNKDLTKAIDASLKKLKENGKYDEILTKYLGESQ